MSQTRTIADLIPLTFWINGVRVRALKTFDVTNTLQQFLDDASLEIANPLNALGLRHYPTNVQLGQSLEIRWKDDVMFSGVIESLVSDRSAVSADPKFTVKSRDLLADSFETDAEPKPERTITDNALLKELFGTKFTYVLDAPFTLTKFAIHSGETTSKVAERAAKLGGFMLWLEGTVIHKAKPITTGVPILTLDERRGHLESYKVTQDITSAKSKLVAYSSNDKNESQKEQRAVDLTIRLRTSTYTPPLTRVNRYTLDKGDKAALRQQVEELEDASQPKETVEVTIADLQKVPLNSLVHLIIPEEGIDAPLMCVSRKWKLAANGQRTTDLILTIPGRKTWR